MKRVLKVNQKGRRERVSAREIAKMIVEALESERDFYLEWLLDEDYGQIEDELTEYLTAGP